jgi:hypothetical protein
LIHILIFFEFGFEFAEIFEFESFYPEVLCPAEQKIFGRKRLVKLLELFDMVLSGHDQASAVSSLSSQISAGCPTPLNKFLRVSDPSA